MYRNSNAYVLLSKSLGAIFAYARRKHGGRVERVWALNAGTELESFDGRRECSTDAMADLSRPDREEMEEVEVINEAFSTTILPIRPENPSPTLKSMFSVSEKGAFSF